MGRTSVVQVGGSLRALLALPEEIVILAGDEREKNGALSVRKRVSSFAFPSTSVQSSGSAVKGWVIFVEKRVSQISY